MMPDWTVWVALIGAGALVGGVIILARWIDSPPDWDDHPRNWR
jgi:hypothetical protein